jgi:hypothetical protein
LKPAIRPGPKTLAVYDLLEGLGFGFVQVQHNSFMFTKPLDEVDAPG